MMNYISMFAEKFTVAEARSFVEANRGEGLSCPVCNQYVKVYARQIHSSMASDLIKIYQSAGGQDGVPVYLPGVLGHSGGGDTAKLKHWQLITPSTPVEPGQSGGKRDGWWQLTLDGKKFVEGTLAVPNKVLLYNGTMIGYPKAIKRVTIKQVLGTRFSYDQLMREAA